MLKLKIILPILLTTVMLLFSGCATLDKATYYSIENSEYDHFIPSYPDRENKLALYSESDQHICLYHDETKKQTVNFVTLTNKYSAVSRGPLYIPIIPTFGFPTYRTPERSHAVLVAFHTTGGATVNFNINDFKLIDPDGNEYPVVDSFDHRYHSNMKCFTFDISEEFYETCIIDFGDISINGDAPFHFVLDFEMQNKFYYFRGFILSW